MHPTDYIHLRWIVFFFSVYFLFMKSITMLIPVFNEQENITQTYKVLKQFFETNYKNIDLEILFVDNHSNDESRNIILNLCKKDKKIKFLRYRHNIGFDASVYNGHKYTSGDAIITMDCDRQDPIDTLKIFIDKWMEGYDLVYGVRTNENESFVYRYLRKVYYNLINKFSYFKYPVNAGEFRLIDKTIKDKLLKSELYYPYMRGMTYYLSKNPFSFEYKRKNRQWGESKYRLFNSVKYALNAIIEESKFIQRFLFCFFLITNFSFLAISIYDILIKNINIKIYFLLIALNLFIVSLISFLNNEYIFREFTKKKIISSNLVEESYNL